ncbi:DUF4214 domain-containing protein [Massilia sp. 9I]|uniref:DUF4214 domain-containing protein n=1 Tax=Massilia sp. 9I TaxID=2653152 RepID=UPI0012F2BD84|nr:DUF4214 domain-containing protein [Massilia sp. 9I]VXC38296.1 exported hypothetical protein [Massilia sp. 9I]
MWTAKRFPFSSVHAVSFVLAAALAACGGSDTAPGSASMSNKSAAQVQAVVGTITMPGKRADYKIERVAGSVQLTHNVTAVVTRVGANSRVRFDDFTYAMDVDGNAGMAYRMYKAAFARTPDVRGLSYWIQVMDNGSSLNAIAQDFIKSSEYRQVYGINPSDTDVVSRYYRNVLGREGEPAGIQYWVGVLRNRQASLADVLAGFSESPENQEGVQALIGNGVAYREPGVNYIAVADAGPARTGVVGSAITLDGSNSLGRNENLGYSWTVTERPAGSSAPLLNANTAFPTITPDREGMYRLSLQIDDGATRSTATTYVSIAPPPLGFVPTDARYSRGLEKVITISTNPNALSIVDPFASSVRSVPLPAPVKNFSLSPNGKLAIVLYESVASLVDLESATLVKSFATGGKHTDAFLTDTGIAYFIGQTGGQWVTPSIVYFNARTGEDISKPVTGSFAFFYGTQYGIYAGLKNKVFLMSQGLSPADLNFFTIDPATNNVIDSGDSPYHGDYSMSTPLYLSETQDLLFTSTGNIFNTSNLRYAGALTLGSGESIVSLSNSFAKDETVVLAAKNDWYQSATTLPSRYQIFNSPLFFPGGSAELPVIEGKQTYGLKIWHSAAGRRVVLVQQGSATPQAAGIKYFVMGL